MREEYHRAITAQALCGLFSEVALEAVVFSNLHQDRLRGQIGHPEFHFDDNAFERSRAYMEANRLQVLPALEQGRPVLAWHAFGRLTHAAQDFYAHSNYVTLWLEQYPEGAWPIPEDIDPLDEKILASPLRSGKIYWPLDPLSWVPALKRFILPFLPDDSHAWMNLDAPERGLKFAYGFAAAVKRTRFECVQTICLLPQDLRTRFAG
jgi:hypothetical protein